MLHKTYVSELTRSLEYLPTWLPATELRLGDLVVASGDSLRRVGHIGDCGLAFTPRFGTSRANFEYLSSGGVSITSKRLQVKFLLEVRWQRQKLVWL
jgi:hypothetical protein